MSQPLPQALPSFAGTLNDKACVIATTSFRRRRSSTLSSPFDSIPVLTDNHHALCPPRLPLANVQSAPPPPPPPRTGPLVSSRNLSSKATHKRDGSPRKESKANSPTDCQPVPILASRSNSASLTIYRSPTVEPKGGNPSSTRLFRCFRGCTIVSEHYKVPLKGGIGCIPMERRCTLPVFSRPSKAKGAVLLIPGFSSNRSVFDVRGEEDRGGVSFFEYLGYRGYDTYSIDLRGSREAQGMGSRSPAYLKEHVEVDVPSSITFIKSFGHQKVYLIGHSMGGAISCAVAGFVPHDVAGIVHLAGLYNFSIPILADAIDLYQKRIQSTVRIRSKIWFSEGTGFALKSAVKLMAPMISTAFHLLSPPQSLTSPPAILPPPMGDEFEVRNFAVDRIPRPSFAVATIHSFITELRRRPIPIRSALETMIQLRPYVPERISNFLLNCWYPLPWVPYSISNPWSLLEKAVESPTIGILIAVLKGAVVQDEAEAYNKWITESSEHRKEVRKHTAELESIHVATAISSIGRSNGPHVARAVENEGFVPGTSTRLDAIGNPPSTDSLLKQATSVGLDPQFDGHDILRNVLSHAATSAKHPSPLPVGENVTDKPRTKLKGPASKPLNPAFSRWNELGPYLERFEQLESLPLFFCHANKDTVLRPKDTLAGFSRSTSRWKAKIVYAGDETAERPEPPFSSGREDAFNSLDSRRKMRESLQLTPIQPPTETSSRTTSSTRPPQGPKVPPSLSDRYEVPGNVSYGHCDILMQNEIWERITEWLDVTSSRERDWRYKRRYSAK